MRGADFRTDINGLRGISVALVVAYHLQLKGAGGGFIGVDVFFVISGYLMTCIIRRGLASDRFSYVSFVCARAARIWPALAALLVVCFAVGALWLPSFDLRNLADQAPWALSFVSNHYFLARSGYNTQSADDLWLLHTWSLSLEWQFYVLYPLLLIAAARLWQRLRPVQAKPQLRAVLLVAVLLAAVASFALQLLQTRSGMQAGFFLLPARAWELLAGGVVCLLEREHDGPRARWRPLAGHAGLVLLLGSALAIAVWRVPAVGSGAFMLAPIAGAMLVLWANDTHNVVLRQRWLQCVGRWSYSIYLWHWPLIVALRLTSYPLDHPWLSSLAATAASILFGWLSFRYVERRAGTALALPAWRVAAKPALALTLAGAATLAVAATGGLSFRDRERDSSYRGYETSIAPLNFPERCSNFKVTAQQLQVCPIDRQGGRRRVLVIGDSHAGHLWPWFVRHSQVAVDFFTASECPPVPYFERLQPGYHCKDYASIAWRKAASPAYDTVVVSARWATLGLRGPPYCHQPADGPCAKVPAARKQQLVLTELRAAIESSLQAGKTVVVLDSAPESRFRVPQRLAREMFWFDQPRLTIDAASWRAESAWVDALFAELEAVPGFHLVSLREQLCNDTACRVYDSTMQRPIYMDESHFDPIWVAQNAGVLAPFVSAN